MSESQNKSSLSTTTANSVRDRRSQSHSTTQYHSINYQRYKQQSSQIRDDISVSFHDTYSDNQRIHQHSENGLTTQQASSKLIELIENLLNEKEAMNPFKTWTILRREFLKITPLLYFVGVALLVVAYALEYDKGFSAVHLIVEAALLLSFTVLHLFMTVREQKLEHNETIAKARGHLRRYRACSDILQDGVTTSSESISLVSVCRDDRWRRIPLTLLVEGELVSLREGEKVPTHLECIEPGFQNIHLSPGEIYTSSLLESKLSQLNPNFSPEETAMNREKLYNSGRSCFMSKETPSFNQISMSIEAPSKLRPTNPVIKAINYIYIVIERFLWISVSISLVANILRAIFQSQRSLVDVLIIRQVNLIIAFSFVMLPCVLLLIAYSLGHAKLLALFDVLQERSLQGEISDDHPALNFDREFNDDRIPDIPFKLLKNYWEAILSTKHVAFSHSSNLLHSIASTTVLCCIDKDGIVSEPVNTIGEISFLKDEPVRLELSSEYSHTQYSITFNDSTWRDNINALKPLGLDCLLNRTCRMFSESLVGGSSSRPNSSLPHSSSQAILTDQASKLQLIRDREDCSDTNSQCLCLLAKEIGFSDDVSSQYQLLKEIHTLTQHHPFRSKSSLLNNSSEENNNKSSSHLLELVDPSPYMISLVSKDINSDTLQLLTKGSTDLVLDHCKYFWDGEQIRNFGESEKEKILQTYHKWVLNEGLKCISFAFKSIDKKYKKIFSSGSVNSPLVDVRFSNTMRRHNSKSNIRVQITSKSISDSSSNIFKPPSTAELNVLKTSSLLDPTTNTNPEKSQQKEKEKEVDKRSLLLSPKSDIVIVVESPLPCSSAGPTPRSIKKKKKRVSYQNKLEKVDENEDSNSVVTSATSVPMGDNLFLPPVELQYESGEEDDDDDEEEEENEEQIQNQQQQQQQQDKQEEESKPIVEMKTSDLVDTDEDDENDSDDSSSESEYSNNDSETESDNPNKKSGASKKSIASGDQLLLLSKDETNSFSVSETSESDSKSKSRVTSKSRNSPITKKSPSSPQQQQQKRNSIIINSIHKNQQQLQLSPKSQHKPQIIEVSSTELLGKSIGESQSISYQDLTCEGNNDILEQLQDDQIFIGMAGMKELPKSHANHFVEVLRQAGIRFVFFSDEDKRSSSPFAHKLGLETDWNCSISLRDPAPSDPVVQDGPSRLPRGVSSIRKHLEEVDNVPLLVPMFSDCTPDTKTEMIKILQENGEVVCCIGSALNYDNTPIFCQSDLALSLEPAVARCLNLPLNKSDPRPLLTSRNFFETESITHPHLPLQTAHVSTKRVPADNPSTDSLCSDITSLPCSLVFHRRTDFNEILKFFHVGRQLLTNTRQCLLFILSASMSLVLISLLAGILVGSITRNGVVGNIPMTGLQLMWLEFIIIPLIGFSLLATPEDPDLMRTLSPKNNSEFKHIPTFAGYIAIRLVPSILLTVWFFIWALHSLSGASWANIFGAKMSEWPTNPSIPFNDSVLVSQNIMMFAFVYYLCVTSISFIHHTQSILKFNPLKNYVWVFVVLFCLGLQIGFLLISLKVIGGISLLSDVAWELYIVLFCWAVGVVVLDEFTKRLYKKWFDDLQLELRLEFDTKLGMHSPI
eukprot:gene3789-4714_t